MTIGELIQRKVRPEPEPAEPSDLLNREQPCECGGACCGSPLIEPKRFRA